MANFKLLTLLGVLCAFAVPSHGYGRIVGGNQTTIERRPYMASLQMQTIPISHSCGATIISTKHLLSAAHCNPGGSVVFLYARIGTTAYNTGGQLMKIATFTSHPQYDRNSLDYDFGILTFPAGVEITLGPTVAIIPLTDNTNPADGSLGTVVGWGSTRENNNTTPLMLREVDIPFVSQTVCKATYSFLTDRQICLGGTPQGMLSPCFGDSGGPAVQDGVQYGIVSGADSCEKPNIPVIFARISSVRDWITELSGV